MPQGGEIHPQHIALDHLELRIQGQALRQITVEFNHAQRTEHSRQRPGDGRQARPYFHHTLPALRCYGGNNLFDHQGIDQKMLAKSLFGLMLQK